MGPAIHAAAHRGQVIDVFMPKQRDLKAATTLFAMAITSNGEPAEAALLHKAAPPDAKHQMGRKPRIEMHCEDMGATVLMSSRGAAGCGIILPTLSATVPPNCSGSARSTDTCQDVSAPASRSRRLGIGRKQ